MRFAASIRLNDLQNLLTSMSNHSHYLRVERLIVTAPQTQAPDENPPLAVTMDVFGYQHARETQSQWFPESGALAGEVGRLRACAAIERTSVCRVAIVRFTGNRAQPILVYSWYSRFSVSRS